MSAISSLAFILKQIQTELLPIQGLFESKSHKKVQIIIPKNNFYGRVETKLLLTRSNIFNLFQKAINSQKDQLLQVDEQNILLIVKSKLELLHNDAKYLLKEGIFIFCSDILELAELGQKQNIKDIIKQLIKDINFAMLPLLRLYFIYQEYLSSSQTNKENEIKNLSLEELFLVSKRSKEGDSQKEFLLEKMENELMNTPINLLIQRETLKQANNMKQGLEICRICSSKIQLVNIKNHVYLCQKKSILKQQLQQKNAQIAELLGKIKKRYTSILQKLECDKIDNDFKLLVKRILCTEKKKERYIVRRCSLIGVNSEKNLRDKIQTYIQDFIEENGDDEVLAMILTCCREKTCIQKKINRVESICLGNRQNLSISDKNQKAEENINLQLARPKSKSLYNHTNDIIDLDLDSEDDENVSFNVLDFSQVNTQKLDVFFKSRKTVTKNNFQSQYKEILAAKHFSSLHDIICQADKELTISLDSFEILQFLGRGSFGRVYMARRKETKDIYAIKIIKICQNYGKNQLLSIKNEHQIFKKIAGDHLVTAPFSFTEQSSIVFVLQYLPGGDLRNILDEEVYFDENRAKSYLAEIVLAIQHLHNFGIIHRDLKPENLVIDQFGHLKLTDFGLSEFKIKQKLTKKLEIDQQTCLIRKSSKKRSAVLGSTKRNLKLIGTPDYIAPQIINQTSLNNQSIDWWSLGVMAYELMVGARPFCAETIEQIIENITNFNIEWPEIGFEEGMITPNAKSLITQLLDSNYNSRLGARNVSDIKNHPFFAGVKWDEIKYSQPPVIPTITNMKDLNSLSEDSDLRDEIKEFIEKGDKPNKMKLKRFVRFDLLGSETIDSFEKVYQKQQKHLQKLKCLQSEFEKNQFC